VLDIDSDQVELLRRLGLKVYYGDASRHDLLHSAGAAKARMIVLALDSPEKTLELVHIVKKHFPQLTIFARAFDWADAHQLIEAGVDYVYREALDSSLRLGEDILRSLGVRAYQAHRATRKFLRHDDQSLRILAAHRRKDRTSYINAARRRIEDLEQLFEADRVDTELSRDEGWDIDTLREEVNRSEWRR
jgi:voltage-gated potassium channel Kch